jgi:hypothetical protein
VEFVGKLNRRDEWDYLTFVDADQGQGWLKDEIPFTRLSWYDWEGKDFSQKAYFKLQIPEVPEGWWGEAAEEEDVGEPPDDPPLISPDTPPDVMVEVYTEIDGVGKTEMHPVLSGLPYLIIIYAKLDKSLLFGDDPSTNIVYRWKVIVPRGETRSGCTDLHAIRDKIRPEAKESYQGDYHLDFFFVNIPALVPEPPAPVPEPTEDDGKAVGDIP